MAAANPASNQTRRLEEWLATPQAYPHGPAIVEKVETHISSVFLAGPLVYKLKKPVKLDFLDFSSLDQREFACREEVRLNTRLAPGAYLGVVPITCDPSGTLALNGPGETIDWLVEMRRLPLERSLLQLHRRGLLLPPHLQQIAQTLARFYKQQQPLRLNAADYLRSYTAHVRDNRATLLDLASAQEQERILRVHSYQLQTLGLYPQLLEERVVAGRIYDGHGDLRPEHILLDETVSIFDCIEFSAELRRIDAADELAFLVAECDYIGASWVEPFLFAEYSHQTGDHPTRTLIDFYKSYRASVRAKVAAIRAGQLIGHERQQAAEEVSAHLQLADQYCAPHQRSLIVIVGGLSGTGKSTLAQAIADALGAKLLRSDVIRREVFTADAAERAIYQADARQQVYDVMFAQADELRLRQIPVVIDATFASRRNVQQFSEFSELPPSRTLFVECWCAPEIAKQRIADRLRAGNDPSEATTDVYESQRQSWESWPPELSACRVNTEQPLTEQVLQVYAALAQR